MGFFDIFTGGNSGLSKDANNLGSLAGYSTGVGEKGTTAALNYDLGLLSGDPSRVAQTLAPEQQQIQTQAGQNRNTVAQFGNRGGGMNAVMAGLDDATRAKLLALTGGLRQGAAANAGNLGTANLGLAQQGTMDKAKLDQMMHENLLNGIFGKAISAGIGGLEKWGLSKLPGANANAGTGNGGGGVSNFAGIQTSPDTSVDNYQIPYV